MRDSILGKVYYLTSVVSPYQIWPKRQSVRSLLRFYDACYYTFITRNAQYTVLQSRKGWSWRISGYDKAVVSTCSLAEKKETMAPNRVILISCGSYNPPTNMHLRMFEIARDHLHRMGNHIVVGGVISPVHDAYAKKDLASATHRCAMLRLALQNSEWVKLSTWEVRQSSWTRTRMSLQHHQNLLNLITFDTNDVRSNIPIEDLDWIPENIKNNLDQMPIQIKLLCGADLLESFGKRDLWVEEDIDAIVGQHGLVVITREGSNPNKFIYDSDILSRHMHNIHIVTEWIPNEVSSTRIRRAFKRGESVRYLIQDSVIDYVYKNGIYDAKSTPTTIKLDLTSPNANDYLTIDPKYQSTFLTPSPSDVTMESPSPVEIISIDVPDTVLRKNLQNATSAAFVASSRQSAGLEEAREKFINALAAENGNVKHVTSSTKAAYPGQAKQIIATESGESQILDEVCSVNDERRVTSVQPRPSKVNETFTNDLGLFEDVSVKVDRVETVVGPSVENVEQVCSKMDSVCEKLAEDSCEENHETCLSSVEENLEVEKDPRFECALSDYTLSTADHTYSRIVDKNEKHDCKLVGEQHSGVKENLQNQCSRVKENVQDQCSGVKEDVQNQRSGAKEDIQDERSGVKEDVENQRSGAKEDFQNQRSEAKEDIQDQRSRVKEDFQDQRSGVKEDVQDQRSGVKEDVHDQRLGFREDVEDQHSRVKKDVQDQRLGVNEDVQDQRLGVNEDVQDQRLGVNEDVQDQRSRVKENIEHEADIVNKRKNDQEESNNVQRDNETILDILVDTKKDREEDNSTVQNVELSPAASTIEPVSVIENPAVKEESLMMREKNKVLVVVPKAEEKLFSTKEILEIEEFQPAKRSSKRDPSLEIDGKYLKSVVNSRKSPRKLKDSQLRQFECASPTDQDHIDDSMVSQRSGKVKLSKFNPSKGISETRSQEETAMNPRRYDTALKGSLDSMIKANESKTMFRRKTKNTKDTFSKKSKSYESIKKIQEIYLGEPSKTDSSTSQTLVTAEEFDTQTDEFCSICCYMNELTLRTEEEISSPNQETFYTLRSNCSSLEDSTECDICSSWNLQSSTELLNRTILSTNNDESICEICEICGEVEENIEFHKDFMIPRKTKGYQEKQLAREDGRILDNATITDVSLEDDSFEIENCGLVSGTESMDDRRFFLSKGEARDIDKVTSKFVHSRGTSLKSREKYFVPKDELAILSSGSRKIMRKGSLLKKKVDDQQNVGQQNKRRYSSADNLQLAKVFTRSDKPLRSKSGRSIGSADNIRSSKNTRRCKSLQRSADNVRYLDSSTDNLDSLAESLGQEDNDEEKRSFDWNEKPKVRDNETVKMILTKHGIKIISEKETAL